MSVSITAACHCKNVRLEFSFQEVELPLVAYICHCDSCRRTHGTLGAYHAALPKAPTLTELSTLSKYISSAKVSRYFCSTCGVQVVDHNKNNDSWVIATALFQKPQSILRYEYHMFIADTLDGGQSDWVNSVQGQLLTRWLEWPKKSPQAPNSWRDSKTKMKGTDETHTTRFAKLHCYCRCKGVEFYLDSAASPENDFLSRNEPVIKRCVAEKEQKWRASNCVCDTCRAISGAEITQWISVPRIAVSLVDNESLSNRIFGSLKEYRSSNRASRYFCNRCGACAFYYKDDQPLSVDVAFGLVHTSSGARAEEWVEWDRNIDWEEDGAGRGFVEGLREGLSRY